MKHPEVVALIAALKVMRERDRDGGIYFDRNQAMYLEFLVQQMLELRLIATNVRFAIEDLNGVLPSESDEVSA